MENLRHNLIELKEKYNACGIKVEFESENFSDIELNQIKKLAYDIDIPLVLKLGGFSSFRDLTKAKELSTDVIIAPMVETSYALQKFIKTYADIFFNDEKKPKLYISIETKTAIENIVEILNSPYMERIKGVVFGRGDLADSMNLKNVEDKKILKIAQVIKEKVASYNKTLTIGGGVTKKSLDFLNTISPDFTETRKIIFKGVPNQSQIEKALIFEQNLILSKKILSSYDHERIQKLSKRINQYSIISK